MRYGTFDLFSGEHIFQDGGDLVDQRSAIRRFARKQAHLAANCGTDLSVRQPRKIVEQYRIAGSFLDLEFQVDGVSFGGIAELDGGKNSEGGEPVGGFLNLG